MKTKLKIYSKASEDEALNTKKEAFEASGLSSRAEMLEVIKEVEAGTNQLKYWAQNKLPNPNLLRHIDDLRLGKEAEPYMLCEDNWEGFLKYTQQTEEEV